jgi:type III restriction enzyme
MRLKFKHQKFQADAAKSVVDVFAGQPHQEGIRHQIDPGNDRQTTTFTPDIGFGNAPIRLSESTVLDNIRKIQQSEQLKPSDELHGTYNLTLEMETGTGKTYTYIKTMYELNKIYGWSKFIVVVPSVAIREGVFKSLEMTADHFADEYGKKIRYFIYNSGKLNDVERFASDSNINLMIINSQACNSPEFDKKTGKLKDNQRNKIFKKMDEFRSRRPIDIIAKTNPILIIDEPQSVEGDKTRAALKLYKPLFTLRYSATHKDDYDMIYRLDAMEAYNKKLVKKISVKGISITGSTATEGYIYVQSINVSTGNPTATIEIDFKSSQKVSKKTITVKEKDNLYAKSNSLPEYENNFVVLKIDGRDNSIEFTNGLKLFAGDAIGTVSEDQIRRIQIRETISSHLERERQLFHKGIKVLSLFFIDEVAKYRVYDGSTQIPGEYAKVFEDEYNTAIAQQTFDRDYMDYLHRFPTEKIHGGYFSIDKTTKHYVDSKIEDRKEKTSGDSEAYDTIMKEKERLLSFDEPMRFIFSHSALREGWDNPNVFQICTLKQSGSDIRKRQEVGRGLRLCVNQSGERMDTNFLGRDVHNINVLTVIANESYDKFSKGLQTELAEAVGHRPKKVEPALFIDKVIRDTDGNEQIVDSNLATAIHESLIVNGYIKGGMLTPKYYEDKQNNAVTVADEAADSAADIIKIIDSVYDPNANKPDDARKNNVELTLDEKKLTSKEFKSLWERINRHSYYLVDFDEAELIKKAIDALRKLQVSKVYVKIEEGNLKEIKSREQLKSGEAFTRTDGDREATALVANAMVRYDLIGKLVVETGLTRNAVAKILRGAGKEIIAQFANNPEEFILKAGTMINDEKATVIIEHITYDKLESAYDTSVFTEPTMKGKLGINTIATPNRHLYDHVIYDSDGERKFAEKLDTEKPVAVYVKLPGGFYISTPVGKYNPDWAIAFHEGNVKHIYFVAETKGDMGSLQLRTIENAKIHCATEHFKAISGDNVVYDVVDSYESLLNKVMK